MGMPSEYHHLTRPTGPILSLLSKVWKPYTTKPSKHHWLPTHLHGCGTERVNHHTTMPCESISFTHKNYLPCLHAYRNQRVNLQSTKPCKFHWLPSATLHVYLLMRGLTLTVSNFLKHLDSLHIKMPVIILQGYEPPPPPPPFISAHSGPSNCLKRERLSRADIPSRFSSESLITDIPIPSTCQEYQTPGIRPQWHGPQLQY